MLTDQAINTALAHVTGVKVALLPMKSRCAVHCEVVQTVHGTLPFVFSIAKSGNKSYCTTTPSVVFPCSSHVGISVRLAYGGPFFPCTMLDQ
jgi:hypothetical protein